MNDQDIVNSPTKLCQTKYIVLYDSLLYGFSIEQQTARVGCGLPL